MTDSKRKEISTRFGVVIAFLVLLCGAIVYRAGYIMMMERDYGARQLESLKVDSLPLKPTRGRILSADGQLLASSLPEYKIFLDFQTLKSQSDSLFRASLDSICQGLHLIFPERSPEDFRAHLMQGYDANSRYWPIYAKKLQSGRYSPIAINYTKYKEVKQLPVFQLSPNRGGFTSSQLPNRRKWPYGSLARRTLGNTTQDTDSATSGLELAYDSVLRGNPGWYHTQRVRNRNLTITDVQPDNGCDLVTTLDIGMQDICEKTLRNQMNEIGAYAGTVVLMETNTGDVKAIVNLDRADSGLLYEGTPHAISDLMEPGSTFKTASILVALDDGMVDMNYTVATGSGIRPMHGAMMRDHNYRNGGCGTIDVSQVLMKSSNIGTSMIIDGRYGLEKADKYVDGLYRIGIAEDLKLPLREYKAPRIRRPNAKNWWKTTLAWMSIGYETQISPMNTLAFYNAIANDGKMMRPRFVKHVEKDGKILYTYEPEVIKESICKPETLDKIRGILIRVVNEGVAKQAGSRQFQVAGKTGTAQVSQGKGGYHSGIMNYLVSFCGYFPAERPKYTMIVAMQKRGTPASGGSQCGPVFREIANKIYARDLTKTLEEANDTIHTHTPNVKNGDLKAAEYLLNELEVNNRTTGERQANQAWGKTENVGTTVQLHATKQHKDIVPNVIGMGAKDAVYLLESRGLKVKIHGTGSVHTQSISAGSKITKGAQISIALR